MASVSCSLTATQIFAGPLPTQFGRRLAQLKELKLSGNKCTGAFGILLDANIPRTFPRRTRPVVPCSESNRPPRIESTPAPTDCCPTVTGPLPTQLGHLSQLQKLWLHGNKFSGAFGILFHVPRTFPAGHESHDTRPVASFSEFDSPSHLKSLRQVCCRRSLADSHSFRHWI